jgi:limonene 1,2-monooxygenase
VRQLDYQTRGRVMFGVGPGSLPSDAYMMGVPTPKVRDRMDEAIEPIIRLLNGETVTAKSEWFDLQEARLQLPAYNDEGIEIAVASMVSPTGARTAGQFGLGLLSLSATSKGSFNALGSNWAIAEESARDHGKTVNRSAWRVVGPMHIAETREQARKNVRWGLEKWIDYVANIAALPLAPPPGMDPVDALVDSGYAVIGTPDDCVKQIERLMAQSGGFGAFLQMDAPWADWAETKRSYELIARYVIPKINNLNANRKASEHWLRTNNEKFRGELQSAVAAKVAQHAAEKGKEQLSPDILKALSHKL